MFRFDGGHSVNHDENSGSSLFSLFYFLEAGSQLIETDGRDEEPV